MTQLYDLTKYPQIFRSSYWGQFEQNGNVDCCTDEIIKNRNAFVEDFGIAKPYVMSEKDYRFFNELHITRDHTEYYKSKKDEIVVLFSLYKGTDKGTERSLVFGFKKYPPVYHVNANSYVFVFKNRYEIKNKCIEFQPKLKELEVTPKNKFEAISYSDLLNQEKKTSQLHEECKLKMRR